MAKETFRSIVTDGVKLRVESINDYINENLVDWEKIDEKRLSDICTELDKIYLTLMTAR